STSHAPSADAGGGGDATPCAPALRRARRAVPRARYTCDGPVRQTTGSRRSVGGAGVRWEIQLEGEAGAPVGTGLEGEPRVHRFDQLARDREPEDRKSVV